MRVFVSLALVATMLTACAPEPVSTVAVVAKPVQPRHPATVVAATGDVHTVRVIRPDATGHFPGDYAAAWNARPAYEAAHHGGGRAPVAVVAPAVPAGKYTPPAVPAGKYTPATVAAVPAGAAVAVRRPVPRQSAYEAHDVYRPPMDCYIMSQSQPEPWVGKRYACVER